MAGNNQRFDSFARRMRDGLIALNQGRYGIDELGKFLLGAAIVCMIASLSRIRLFWFLSTALLLWQLFRMYSRNYPARARENSWFLGKTERQRAWFSLLDKRWTNRRTTRYIRCPHCRKVFSLPKGKGKIRATCPHCREQSIHTT